MHRIALVLVAVCLAAAAIGGVASQARATNNYSNVVPCLNGGWQNLMRTSGTTFKSQFECQQYAVFGGVPIPRCTAGSEDFSEDANFSKPTTFAGGSIDGPYGVGGSARIQGTSWSGHFPAGTHVLFTGSTNPAAPFRLTFTKAVSGLDLTAESNNSPTNPLPFTLTLKAYDSSNALVDTDAVTTIPPTPLSVDSATNANNIKYVTLETTSTFHGLAFSNMVWGCAA